MNCSFVRFFVAVSAAFWVAGCSGGGGLKGDFCLGTPDCAAGYQCRSAGGGLGTCQLPTTGGFTATEKVCIALECTEDQDCGAGACSGGLCTCNGDDDCVDHPAGPHCLSGECVQCTDANDCVGEEVLCNADNLCVNKCKGRHECAAFHDCSAESCTLVGCVSDRECKIEGSGNNPDLDWACDESMGTPTCRVKCKSDFDCRGWQGVGNGYAETCSGGVCVPIGCEDEIECHNIHGTHSHGYRCQEQAG